METISKPEASAANSVDDIVPERPKHGRGSRGGRIPGQRRNGRGGARAEKRPGE